MFNILTKKINSKFFIFLIFFAGSLFFYFNILDIYFFSDDFEWLSFGERIKDDIFNIYKLRVSSFYAPVVNFFFFLGQILFPYNYFLYHLVILILHSLNSFLLFLLADKIYKNKLASFLGGLFFLFAAYHYEAVIWISAVMHILVVFLILSSCLMYIKYIDTKNNKYILFSYILAILSFFTKESGIVIFSFIPLLYFNFQNKNLFFYKNWKHLLPFFITLINILIYSYLWQRNSLWVTAGIYKIEFSAIRQLINSTVALFYFPLADFFIANINLIYIFIFCLGIATLFFIFYKKYRKKYLLSMCFIIFGFLPTLFFYYGTWNTISASRYAYLPAVGGALLISLIFVFLRNFYFKKITTFIFIILIISCLYQNYYITANTHTEYKKVDQQMRGMVNSFTKHRDKIDNSDKVIIIQSYPFHGNNYYQYMYKYFINDNYNGEWHTELDWNIGMSKYNVDNNLILGWDNNNMEFFIANDKNNSIQNPALINKKYPDKCLVKNKTDLNKIKLPIEILKIDRIKYFEFSKTLLLVVEEKDSNRALWSYNGLDFQRLLKIDKVFFNGFIEIDSKNNIYFITNNPNLIYRSSNYGKNWQLVSDALPPFWGIADNGNKTLYGSAWTFNSPVIYKSINQGRTWETWKNFSNIFPAEAIKYNENDERFKIRHLHDIVYYKNKIIVGTGDKTRWTLISDESGGEWRQIWNEGFTSHVLIPSDDVILLGSDKNGGYGIASYNFSTNKTSRVWNPLDCDWSGYIYDIIKKDEKYYAAVHNEYSNSLKYGVIMSEDYKNWYPIIEIMPKEEEFQSQAFIANSSSNLVYLSLNGFLYNFLQ